MVTRKDKTYIVVSCSVIVAYDVCMIIIKGTININVDSTLQRHVRSSYHTLTCNGLYFVCVRILTIRCTYYRIVTRLDGNREALLSMRYPRLTVSILSHLCTGYITLHNVIAEAISVIPETPVVEEAAEYLEIMNVGSIYFTILTIILHTLCHYTITHLKVVVLTIDYVICVATLESKILKLSIAKQTHAILRTIVKSQLGSVAIVMITVKIACYGDVLPHHIVLQF